MKRSKRFTLRRIALGLAVAVVLVPSGQAKPTPSQHADFWNYDANTGVKIANTSPGVAPDELAQLWSGSVVSLGVDDRAFSKATSVGTPSVAAGSGGYDVGPGTVSGFGLALLLLASGAGIAVRHTRRTKLSPA